MCLQVGEGCWVGTCNHQATFNLSSTIVVDKKNPSLERVINTSSAAGNFMQSFVLAWFIFSVTEVIVCMVIVSFKQLPKKGCIG